MTVAEIITNSETAFGRFTSQAVSFDEAAFTAARNDKWTVAQQVDHLIRSMKATKLAYRLPGWVLRIYAGKPNRPSRSYNELVQRYLQKLDAGGKASARFIPPSVTMNKTDLLQAWQRETEIYLHLLRKIRKEEKLDNLLIPHPLLGKLTLRELCYFTIYHTEHHLQQIKSYQ